MTTHAHRAHDRHEPEGVGVTETENDWIAEWREQLGIEVMHAMTCTHHGSDDFGQRAVCVTCFDNTQRIGALVEHLAAAAWDRGRAAERRDWEFTSDLSTPDEDRQPLPNPYRTFPPADPRATARNPERDERTGA